MPPLGNLAAHTEKSIWEQFDPLSMQKSSAALFSNTYLLDPIPDEIRTHDIHVGKVMDVHCTALLSRNLSFRGSSRHQICTKLFPYQA